MSFINAFFLFGLSAALLPVLIHFVRKMRAKKVPFGSLMFLKATPKELIKKRRLRDLLLMAVRAALFALLALAFARPFLPQEQLPFLPQRSQESVVILVDNSYSMQVGTRFEQARQEVLRRLDAAGPGDELAIIAFANEAQQLTPLTDDRVLLRTVAQRTLAVGNRATDFYPALRQAVEILQDARHDAQTIVLLSDFQRNGWSGSLDNWTLPDGITFEPVAVAGGEVRNAYVEDFVLTTKRAGPRVAVRYEARVAAEGAARPNTAALLLGTEAVAQEALPARPTHRVSFQQVAPRDGVFQGHLALGDDDLALDNRYYFTYTVAGRPSLLAVTEGPDDAFFLRNVFAVGEEARYTFTTGTRSQLNRATLQRHDVLFLADVGALTQAQTEALTAYVEGGGSVVVSFGEAVNEAAAAALLRALGIGTGGAVVTARVDQGTEAIIGEVDLRHPVFELFAASGMAAILRPKFRRYVRVVPDSATAVLGAYDTGDPFLMERRRGQGKVLVYTSTFSTRWTDFPINELFVPFVYQLTAHALRSAEARPQFTVGEPVVLKGRPGEAWEVRTPDDRLFPVALDEAGTGFFRETEGPGHYAAALGREVFAFSVNVDPRESVLAARDAEEAYAAVAGPSEVGAATPEAAALVVADEEKRQKLWRYLLLLVIGLFALETVLANRRVPSRR